MPPRRPAAEGRPPPRRPPARSACGQHAMSVHPAAVFVLCVALIMAWPCGAATVQVRRLVELGVRGPEQQAGITTEMNESYVLESVELDASSTALVMVDVWNVTDPMLLDNMHKRLTPLLTSARQLGFTIVHAPSEAKLWSKLRVLPGELLVSGEHGDTARCDLAMRNASRTAQRNITHVLLVGYDTNLCMVDKPCGAVTLSSSLQGEAEVLLIRDTTRPGADSYGNPYFTTHTNVNMIESGAWLPRGRQHIRSLTLADLLAGFHLDAEAAALPPLALPVPQVSHKSPPNRPFTLTVADIQQGTPALVVVSGADDFDNDGFQARVDESMQLHLMPLLDAARATGLLVIHLPNGRHLAYTPRSGEFVLNTTAQLAQVVRDFSVSKLLYCGFAANRELMWGSGGMAHFYAFQRYGYSRLFPGVAAIPQVAWVTGATIALETGATMESQWGLKMALAYRGFGGQISERTLVALLCAAQKASAVVRRTGGVLYSLPGAHHFASSKDAITDADIGSGGGQCGAGTGLLGPKSVTINFTASPQSVDYSTMKDKKMLCFVKTVGTPYAVYQIKGERCLAPHH
jgi:hypothetical protein